MVFCCCSPSASGFDVLCVQRWYSAYLGCNEWLFQFPISRSLSTSRRRTDELGSRLERPIHFECKLNEPMHIGMRLLHPAAADHSVSISRQQVQRIFSFSLRSRAVLIVLLQTYPLKVPQDSVLVDGDSAVVVSFVEWIAHIRLHYPLLCCSDHLPCALQHAKRANTSLKECYGQNVFFKNVSQHDHCLSCLDIEHAEAAFVDESCPHCGGMTVAGLRTRLRFLKRGGVPVPLPRSRVPPGGYRGEATSGSSRAGLTVTVRNSPPKTARAPPVTGTSLTMELPRERAGPSHGGGVLLLSFGAPPDDRMSIATSEGESDQSGDDGSVPLPPSGRPAVPDSDPEMVAILARAAESVGLEWRPPLCPEPSRLDDWFLGVARAGSQGPTPVPFFPEVHDELTGTWTVPFTARNRSSGSSSLATLDGGAARGYTEVPPVERSVAMQLCPRTASTWRGNPLLPSRACRHSSALSVSAYAACGEAASALHAMALLQVHQAKALRDLHEGGHDPGVLSELRTATDLALRATKVTARSLGRAMSTMVVQERHLWLCLADMKEVDKARFLNAPVSQTGLFGDAVENFAQQFSAAQKQTEAIRHILPRRAAAASTRPPNPRSRAADAAASSQAAPWSRPQGSRPARPGPRQTRRQASKQAALRRTTQGWRCLLFGRW